MRIGLLAYHSAINFGATLQLLSTYMFFKNNGYEPIVINWVASDLEAFYNSRSQEGQRSFSLNLRQNIWTESRLCRTSKEVANVISDYNIGGVIIGSDAVCQHHPTIERVSFPCRSIIKIQKYTTDRLFPNVFWGDFLNYLPHPVPVAVMSASSQDSAFNYFGPSLKKKMNKYIYRYSYLSVRDVWTQKMFSHISNGTIIPPVTPDPVFAFNYNAGCLVPNREDILKKKEETNAELENITAFVGTNDFVAIGIMDAITSLGYHIPEDFSVCGFDNTLVASFSGISLTTIDHCIGEKGAYAVSMLINHRTRMEQKDDKKEKKRPIMRLEYEPQLIIRHSTGKRK